MYVSRDSVEGYLGAATLESLGERYAAPAFFGDIPADKMLSLKTAFQAKYQLLRDLIIIENSRNPHPVDANTMNAALSRLDRVYAEVNGGAWDKAPQLESAARGILASVGMSSPTVTAADVLRAMTDIPAQIKALLLATAKTAGETASILTKSAGVDPGEALTTVKLVAGAGIVVGLAYAISVFR